MSKSSLRILTPPLAPLKDATMLLAFSGWMDGGDVSTGTIQRLVEQQKADPIAEIDPEGYYIENFPGSMEISALFRPHVEIAEGLIRSFEVPANVAYCDRQRNLLFFEGREPNLNWPSFSQAVFELAEKANVTRIVFVGSFGGTVPHTREPRLFATVSDRSLKPLLAKYKLRSTNYQGPASFATYLMTRARRHSIEMLSLAAEIPGYLEGTNPLCIEAVTRRLAAMLGLEVNLTAMRSASDDWESRVTAAVQDDPELAERIEQLERDYDDELLKNASLGDWIDDQPHE